MDYSVDTPFRTYQDIQAAIRTKKVVLSYDRSTAFHIACRVNKYYAILNMIIPLISIVMMYFACSFFSTTKWVLLFGIVVFLVNSMVPHIKRVLWIVAVALIALPIFLFNSAMWLVAIGFGIIGMIIGYDIWWGIIARTASKVLMTNEELFESLWKDEKIALRADNTMNGFYIHGKADYNNTIEKLK